MGHQFLFDSRCCAAASPIHLPHLWSGCAAAMAKPQQQEQPPRGQRAPLPCQKRPLSPRSVQFSIFCDFLFVCVVLCHVVLPCLRTNLTSRCFVSNASLPLVPTF